MSEQAIAARLDRLPVSSWHVKMRVLLGVATFFDAFASLAIAYVVPVLIGAWKIGPPQIGAMLAIGFVGWILPSYGVAGMVLLFCVVAAIGALASFAGAVETSGRDLEEISP